ncbi:hypothetical protein PCL_09575 [Purpureocillium lilacinum]|uniref:Peptidase M66 n=1 Tax=Purpureocillium lilacinum TaxID=33203 RepID=A0A2U3DQJ3_PURLI|nr:hypothetical protein PCL_09575 [Purpureocillium lilacinum]
MPDFDDLVKTLSPLFTRRSTGIEVTQSVQYYHSRSHLTDAADRAADNSVTLVAFKPAVVRAYVRPSWGVTTDVPVGGTLLVERKQGIIGPWNVVTTLTPWLRPTMTPIDDDYDDERGTIGNSLNFRIPASDFVGKMRLTLRLDTGETRTTTISAYLVQTLRVRVIQVQYQGPSTSSPAPGTVPPTLNLAAPTLSDAQATAALAFRMMPVQQTGSFASAGTLSWSLPLDDARTAPGACSANWNSLLKSLGAMRDNDGNRADVVYYGLLPAGIPLSVPGCGTGGLGSAAVGNTRTFVHEIGHGYGFQHTPSGNAGATDPGYPVYEPYMSASIGEYGVDIENGMMYSPATSTDYMSYGASRWMSLYQHRRLINHPRLAPTWIQERNPLDDIPILIDPKPWWWPEPPWELDDVEKYAVNPLISVRGLIDETGTVRVDSVARVTASAVMHGPEISWNAQLIGKSGDVAARARMTRVLTHGGGGCGCGCSSGPQKGNPDRLPLEFHAMIPDAELGTALRIIDRNGKKAWERCAPDTPVRFASVEAELSNESTVRFGWCLETDDAFDVWAQYSADRGKTWRGLTVGLCDGSAEVDIAGLPAGQVLLRLLTHDGFSTAASDPVKIKVPERAPYPAILYPAHGELVPANAEFEVLGSAVSQGGDPVDDDCLEWFVDGKSFGRGRAPTLRVKPGDHKLTLRANAQRDAEVTIDFTARAIER